MAKGKSVRKVKFKIPKKLRIGTAVFTVIQDPKDYSASFNFTDMEMRIGTGLLEKNPMQVFELLVHEISEALHVGTMCTRYDDYGTIADFKFFMDHKQFQTHNELLCQIIYEQILV